MSLSLFSISSLLGDSRPSGTGRDGYFIVVDSSLVGCDDGRYMKGMAKFSPSDWEHVKMAYSAGVTDKELCSDFNLKPSTLRKRRSLDGQQGNPWLGPAHSKRVAEEEKMRRKLRVIGNGTEDLPMTADQSIAQKLLAGGEEASERGMSLILKLLRDAVMDKESIRPLEDISDIVQATKGARSIAGMDRPEMSLSVSVAQCFPSE